MACSHACFEGRQVFVHHAFDPIVVGRADRRERALVDIDDPRHCGRLMDGQVARDLQAAQERAHHRDDRAVAGGAGNPQVKLRVELEEAVLAREHVSLVHQLCLCVDDLLQARIVLLAGVDRRQLGDARLDQAPGLEHAGDLVKA